MVLNPVRIFLRHTTNACRPNGSIAWRVCLSDVVELPVAIIENGKAVPAIGGSGVAGDQYAGIGIWVVGDPDGHGDARQWL